MNSAPFNKKWENAFAQCPTNKYSLAVLFNRMRCKARMHMHVATRGNYVRRGLPPGSAPARLRAASSMTKIMQSKDTMPATIM